MGPYLSAPLSNVNSAALRQVISAALCNTLMRTVEVVRRLRLTQLLEEHGTLVALGQRLGLHSRDSTLSQILNESPNSKTGTPKTMGSAMARRIEVAFDKPEGWMDTDPNFDESVWPFGDRVDIRDVLRLNAEALSEAIGALNHIIRRAAPSADPGNRRAA